MTNLFLFTDCQSFIPRQRDMGPALAERKACMAGIQGGGQDGETVDEVVASETHMAHAHGRLQEKKISCD